MEEIVVGIEDCPVHGELDHRLRLADSGNLPGVIGEQLLVNGGMGAIAAVTVSSLGCESFMLRAFQHCGAGGRTAAGAICPG